MAASQERGLFYYVVDRSGSITAYGLTEPIRRAITDHAAQLPEQTEVRLVFFSRTASEPQRWETMTPTSQADFATYFTKNFIPEGPTRLYDTVGEVMDELRATEGDYSFVSVLVFSDGENNWSRNHRSWLSLEPAYNALIERHEQSFIYWITLEFEPAETPPAWVTHEPQPPGTTDIPIPEPAPLTDFTAHPQQLKVGESIQFETVARGGRVTEFLWEFGDGNSSVEQNPIHRYADEGAFTVTLRTMGPGGESEEIKAAFVEVLPEVSLAANFRFSPDRPRVGDFLRFQDISEGNPEAWEWRVGGELFSTAATPQLALEEPGEMELSLTVRRGEVTETVERTLTVLPPPPVAGFSVSPDEATFGEALTFKAETTEEDWVHRWMIDGEVNLEGEQVEWVSDRHGLLQVVHSVESPGGFSRQTDRVFVHPPVEVLPNTAFTVQPRVFVEGDRVRFRARETGEGLVHQWWIGGELVGEGPELEWESEGLGNLVVTHRIQLAGTEAGFESSDEILGRPVELIRVSFAPSRSSGTYPLTVKFRDDSDGRGVSYQWDFGDGGSSSQRHPTHTYEEAGDYSVTLTVTNREGKATSNVEPVSIAVSPPMPLWQKILLGLVGACVFWILVVVPFVLRPMLAPQRGPKLVGIRTYSLHMSARQGWSRFFWPKRIVTIGSAVDSDIRLPKGGGTRGQIAQIERSPATASYSIRPLGGNDIYKIEKQTSLTNPDSEERSRVGRGCLLRDGHTYEIAGERLVWFQPKKLPQGQPKQGKAAAPQKKSAFGNQKNQTLARLRN